MSLIGWWKLDGNAYDSSPSANNGAATGMTYDSSYGKIGQGGNFTGSRATYIDITQIDITTHHSMAFWMYGNTLNPGNPTGSMMMGVFNTTTHFMYAADNTRFQINDGTTERTWDNTNDVDYYHRWRHVVILFKPSELHLFIDGVAQVSNPQVYDGTFTFSNIGAPYTTTSYDFVGNLNDIRIYDHILSTKEIISLAEAKVLHWQFSHERDTSGEQVLDSSGYERHATLDASTPVWSGIDTGKGVGCYQITLASNDYIEISAADFPVVFDDAITISMWIYNDSFGTDFRTLAHGNTTVNWANSYWIALSSTSANMRWSINNDDANDFAHGMVVDTWYHICATYDGSNCNVYVNGVEKAGNFDRGGAITSQNGFKIGLAGNGNYDFGGKMTDVRIYNKGYNAADGLAFATALYQTSAQLDDKGNLWC